MHRNLEGLAQAIVKRRADLRLTLTEIHVRSGIARSTLSRLEAGTSKRVELATLVKLAEALELESGALVEVYRSRPRSSVSLDELERDARRYEAEAARDALRSQLDAQLDELDAEQLAELVAHVRRWRNEVMHSVDLEGFLAARRQVAEQARVLDEMILQAVREQNERYLEGLREALGPIQVPPAVLEGFRTATGSSPAARPGADQDEA